MNEYCPFRFWEITQKKWILFTDGGVLNMDQKNTDRLMNISLVMSHPDGENLRTGRDQIGSLMNGIEMANPFFWNAQSFNDEGIHSLVHDAGAQGHRFGEGNEKLSFRFDSRGFIEYISPKALRVLRLREEDIIGKNIIELSKPLGIRDLSFFDELWTDFRAQHLTEIVIDNTKHWILWNFEAQLNPDATIVCVIATGHEITDFVQQGSHIVQEKNRDFLTGLWNRQGLYEQLFRIESDVSKAVSFFIDCWSLSKITDYYGYHVSDEVVLIMAKEFQKISEKDWIIARYSESTFVVVCFNMSASQAKIDRMLEDFTMNLTSYYTIREMRFQIDKRIGYALYPEDIGDLAKLVSCSSLAMKESIRQDQVSVKRYQRYMSEALEQNLLYAGKLREALERQEIEVFFQKIIDVENNEVVYFEELARWNDRQLGYISPKTMFTIAKESNMLDRLERYLTEKALDAICQVTRDREFQKAKLSLNITPTSLLDPHFLAYLDRKVREKGMNPESICIEICESTFVNSLDLCIERINEFRQHGYSIAIDDFGREYSSLAILENVSFDIIKIDALFVGKISDPKNQEIIKMICRIAEIAKQTIVAEGVETVQQKNALQQLGCLFQQGYFFNRPQRISSLLK